MPGNQVQRILEICRGGGLRIGLVLGFAVLLTGCATTKPEDDYVASVIAEAIRESGGAEEPAVFSRQVEVRRAPLAVQGPAVVSVTGGGAVSASPMGGSPAVQSVVAPVPKPVETPKAEARPVVESRPAVSVPVVAMGATPEVVPEAKIDILHIATPPVVTVKPVEPTIQPDTVLWVSVSEDPSLNGKYIVNNSSSIDFGYVGLVFLQDMTAEQAEQAIRNVLLGRYLNNATVAVKIAKASYDVVGVIGNVERPGDIKIGPGAGIPLTEALRRANGLKSNRESNRVKIIRGGLRNPFGPAADGEVYPLVNADGQMTVPDVYLRNNDLVYVFAADATILDGTIKTTGGKKILLLGEVPRRGVIEFAENEPCTLMHLLFKIGGLPRFAKGDKIQVVRRQKDGAETTFVIDGESLMVNGDPKDDIALESGDRVIVPPRKFAFF